MNEQAITALNKAFIESVKAQIGDDRQHGWGVEDSKHVIEDVIAEDATLEIARLLKEGKKPETYSPSENAMALVKKVINPSAYRQELEKAKKPDGKGGWTTILAKSEKSKREKQTMNYYTTA
jgi:hypothetical protein